MSRPTAFSSRRVFTDTSAYYAVTDPRDDNHVRARPIALALSHEHRRLFTTNFIDIRGAMGGRRHTFRGRRRSHLARVY